MPHLPPDPPSDPWSPRSAGDRLLLLLKTRGPQTAAELGRALGVTAEAARQQLQRLADEGLVEAGSTARGPGRPALRFQPTPAGHARFPDAHADLMVQLIENLRTELGEAALDRLVEARERATRARYLAEIAAAPEDLAGRVADLAAIRRREGYLADWSRDGDSFVICEHHCPIAAAAHACAGFCRAELDSFRDVLGPGVRVERLEHIRAGDRRCAYRIAPDAAPRAVA